MGDLWLILESSRGEFSDEVDALCQNFAARGRIAGVKTVEALYEDGVLRPSEKLALRPGERVNIIVLRRPDPRRWDSGRLAPASRDETILTEQGLSEWVAALDSEDEG